MPETPQTWWFNPVPVLKRQTLVYLFIFASLAAISLLEHRPWWLFFAFLAAIFVAARVAGPLPPQLACLASGGLAVIDSSGNVIHIPLAVAAVSTTPKGCAVTWEEDQSPRESIKLPGFTETDHLAAAIEAARADGSPRTGREMAAQLPMAPVLIPSRWVTSHGFGALAMIVIIMARAWFEWPFYTMVPPVLAFFWLDLQRRKQPWVAVNPAGLWLLRHNQDPRLIPACAVTGARPYLWADCIVQTTDPNCPTLKLGILPDDLRRILTPGGAFHA
jgi:hypothetical protein